MNTPDRKDHHPDFYAEDDNRPQFGTLPFRDQQDIICEFSCDFPAEFRDYSAEAISQMNDNSTLCDLLEYIAKCIDRHHEQEDWTI